MASEARAYHEATKLFAGDAAPRRVDTALVPKPYKRYLDVPSLAPPPWLASLLRCSAGIIRRSRIGGRELSFRAASCTGAAYHIEVYAVSGAVDGLEAGVYHWDVLEERLKTLRPGDHRPNLAAALALRSPDAGVYVVLTSTFWRNAWRYEERAYRHAFWDAGTIVANLLALSRARGLRPRLYAGFADEAVNGLLGLDARREAAVCVVALGQGIATGPELSAGPISPRVEPISRAEIEYPLIWRTHEATSLPDAEAVRAWRKPVPAAVDAPLVAVDEGLEAVIERRVSTRRFRNVPLSRSEFDRLVSTAVAPLEADFRRLTKLQALVHAVEGLAPGVYGVAGGEPVLRRAGTLRKKAAHAALDQAAAGDAAVDFYFVADLDAVLDAFGERGYRAVQLEGGVRGGLVYLQATALGLGATALTFYDDEAAALLGEGPSAAVLFSIAVGR